MKLLHNRQLWQLTVVALAAPLALIAFWPTPVDKPVSGQLAAVLTFLYYHGMPRWFNYQFIEAAANVTLFMSVGFVTALAFPARRWWQIGAFGLLVSGCIELGQLLFLHDRFASLSDIVADTSGAAIGALLAAWTMKKGGPPPFNSRPPRRVKS